jgi:hypothetical protein
MACLTVSGRPGDRRRRPGRDDLCRRGDGGRHVRHPGQPGRARAGARRPGAVAEMSAQAFTLIASGDAGWLSDDVPSIHGRPARYCRQFADYAGVSPRLFV